MEKKILMAVDGSIHANQFLRYAINMLGGSKDVTFTLFHGQPMISQYLLDEARTDPKANASLKKGIKKNTTEAQMLLEKQKKRMITMGVPGERIEMVAQQRMIGLSKGILEYARNGIYDAIDAMQKLEKTGIAADRVEFITTKRKAKVGKMILDEAKKGNYGTVVVGRRGADRAHFFGSVSRYVTERITDRALWLVC
jgi:nucleotide-binding universal stress UspA family protein